MDEAYQRWVEWRHNIGSFNLDELEPYRNYDVKVLDELGKQCDLRALQVLGFRRSHYSEEMGLQFDYNAAVCGSTQALSSLTPVSFLLDKQVLKPKERARERAKFLDELAMFEVGAMRGAKSYIVLGITLLANYRITLTEAEKQAITLKAK